MLEANGVGSQACRSLKAPAISVAESLVKSVKLSLANQQCVPQFQERVEIRQAGEVAKFRAYLRWANRLTPLSGSLRFGASS
jgi:hypothetical protein